VSRRRFAKNRKPVNGKYQMTLGEFIEALKKLDRGAYICFDFAGLRVGEIHSYRGYYSHLATDPTRGPFLDRVGAVIDAYKACLGKTFMGYKGGDFKMDEDTPLWVATYGDSGGSRIVGIDASKDCRIVIKTAPPAIRDRLMAGHLILSQRTVVRPHVPEPSTPSERKPRP
jgi:hypothetical protein